MQEDYIRSADAVDLTEPVREFTGILDSLSLTQLRNARYSWVHLLGCLQSVRVPKVRIA